MSKAQKMAIAIVSGVLAWSPALYAAPPGLTPPSDKDTQTPTADPAPAPPGKPQTQRERREAVKKRIRALRAATLVDELGLDDATAAKLFPIFTRYDEATDKLLDQRNDFQKKLKAAAELKNDKAIERLIDDAEANQRALWDLEERRLGELRKVLTPVQSAKLVVVLPQLERKIQNQIRQAMQQGKGGGGNPGGGPNRKHADPDDDDER